MFKRKPKMEVHAEAGTEVVVRPGPGQVSPSETAVMQRMMGEFMASTALARVQADVGAIARDFAAFRENIHGLNTALGTFREKVMIPIQKELEYVRYNLGARSDDTVGAMQKLVHHLSDQIELVLRARGVDPKARDGAGETAMDRMGIDPNRPDYQTLEREGVPEGADPGETQAAVLDKLRGQVERLEHENEELRRLTLETGVMGPPDIPFKHGDFWVDSLQRRWCFTPPAAR